MKKRGQGADLLKMSHVRFELGLCGIVTTCLYGGWALLIYARYYAAAAITYRQEFIQLRSIMVNSEGEVVFPTAGKGSEATFHKKKLKAKLTGLKDSSVSYPSEKFTTSVLVGAAEVLEQPMWKSTTGRQLPDLKLPKALRNSMYHLLHFPTVAKA